MLDYAVGALSPAMGLLADTHVALNTRGQAQNEVWNMIGGVLLERFEDLYAPLSLSRRPVSDSPCETAASVLSADLAKLSWKTGLSGVDYAKGRTPNTKFMRLFAGRSAPKHKHSVLEATLVLNGELSDGQRHYRPGQIAFGVPGEAHKPMAVGGEVCICFVAQERKPFWRLS